MESWVPSGYVLVERLADGPPERWLARGPGGEGVTLQRITGLDGAAADRLAADLRRLAAVVGSLDSPHVLPILDVVNTPGDVVAVSSCAERGTLAELLDKRGRLSPGEAVTALAPIATVLGELHGRGVAHGHVAAGNVAFRADGRPVLCDVGVRDAIGNRPVATSADDVLALGRLGRGWSATRPTRRDCTACSRRRRPPTRISDRMARASPGRCCAPARPNRFAFVPSRRRIPADATSRDLADGWCRR